MASQGRSLPLDCYVILHIRPGPPYPETTNFPQIAADAPFQLSSDIWIERLDKELAINIQRACEPANYKTYNDVWDRHLYAFVRREPEEERRLRRQPGMVVRDEGVLPLFTVMALSRLVHPTTIGNRYCAKIDPSPETDPAVQALTMSGSNPDVTLGDISHDWLSPVHGDELRQLMPWVDEKRAMPKRVHHAFWKYEEVVRTYFLDSRFPAVVAGLEALITVEKYRNRRQFVQRVEKLARDFGISLSKTELEQAYELRSELTHGRSFLHDLHTVLPMDDQPPLYTKLETLLRVAVKTCLLDDRFRSRFEDDRSVLKEYP